jgi:hypothetical protein
LPQAATQQLPSPLLLLLLDARRAPALQARSVVASAPRRSIGGVHERWRSIAVVVVCAAAGRADCSAARRCLVAQVEV